MLNHYTVAFSNNTVRHGSSPLIMPAVSEPGQLVTVEPIDNTAKSAFVLAYDSCLAALHGAMRGLT